MSDYNKAADIAEKQLKFISPSMCYAKWAQSSIHLTNGMTSSCYHPPLHKISISEIKNTPAALHNTAEKKEERRMMLQGQRPQGCEYCWKIEDANQRSDRIYRSGEGWAQNSRLEIFDALDRGDVVPRYLELNFNQACNFKCMYCSPHLSNSWHNEINLNGPYKILDASGAETFHNDTKYLATQGLMPFNGKQEDNPYIDAFWKWWPEIYKKVEIIRITGGEPLMDVNTFKILDYIYQHPNVSSMSITTNMCPPNPALFDKFIDKLKKLEQIQIWNDPDRFNPGSGNHWYVNMALKNFELFVSLDAMGKQGEYIRPGLNITTLKNNVQQYLANTNNSILTFINTFNILSIPSIKEYLQYILELRIQYSKEAQGIKKIPIYDPYHKHPDYEIHPRQRIWFDLPLLRYPAWQSIECLPESFSSYLQEAIDFMKANSDVENFTGFYDFEISKMERNLAILNNPKSSQLEINRKNFVLFFNQHDARNGTDFRKLFPEFVELFNEWQLL